jgi:hypothetical protein
LTAGSGAADERKIKRLKGELGALISDYNAAENKLNATSSDLLKKDQQLQAAQLHMADLAAKVDALAKEVLAATVQELQGGQVCHAISIGCCGPLEQKLSVSWNVILQVAAVFLQLPSDGHLGVCDHPVA